MPDGNPKQGIIRNDKPLESENGDALGFNKYAIEIANFIISSEHETPFNIGIFGGWGSGKTSFLHMLENNLRGRNYPTVWFNAWKYQETSEIRNALIFAVTAKLTNKDLLENVDIKVKERLINILNGFTTLAIEHITKKDINEVLSHFQNTDESVSQNQGDPGVEFAELIRVLLENNSKNVVYIFIDDLDRCDKDSVFIILRSIRLFLDVPGCVFIFGLDKEMIEHLVALEYRTKEYPIRGPSYIDKMFQLQLDVPIPTKEQIRSLIEHKFESVFDPQIKELLASTIDNPRKLLLIGNDLNRISSVILERDPHLFGDMSDEDYQGICKVVILKHLWHVMYNKLSLEAKLLDHLYDVFNTWNGEIIGAVQKANEGDFTKFSLEKRNAYFIEHSRKGLLRWDERVLKKYEEQGLTEYYTDPSFFNLFIIGERILPRHFIIARSITSSWKREFISVTVR